MLVLHAELLVYINKHVVRTILLCVLIMRLKFTWRMSASDCTVGLKLGPLVLTVYTALEHLPALVLHHTVPAPSTLQDVYLHLFGTKYSAGSRP